MEIDIRTFKKMKMKKKYSKPETTLLHVDMMQILAATISEEITDKPGGGGEYGGEVGAPSWGGAFDDDDTDSSE